MRLAFSAWAMRDWPVERQIRLVSNAGYVGICLVSGAELPFDATRTDRAECRRMRRLLDEAGLAVTAIASRSFRTLTAAADAAGVPLECQTVSST